MLNIEKIAKNIKLREEQIDEKSSRYILEPLYRGYGNTIGNALRRILLSSILGASIKAVRIESVLNEFSTMKGVKESVTDIILNIKEIVVQLDEPTEKRMKLSVKGPKVITAGDIIPDAGVKIINPEQPIATITTNRTFEAEFVVDFGEGFVMSDEIDTSYLGIDFLAVDAIYTPIRKVSYKVEDTMVGRVTNYDKLTLEIVTDGSVDIRETLAYSVELLNMHTKPFLNVGTALSNLRESIELEEEKRVSKQRNLKNIEELELSMRAYNSLKKAGINTIDDLENLSEQEMSKIKNLGKKSVEEIKEKLSIFKESK